MLSALQYLHTSAITHRDLKPENILLATDAEETLVKVTDFGMSKVIESASLLKTMCGTPTYLAPEILATAGTGAYTKAVDLWSLGVILFVCLVGYPPFSAVYNDMPLNDQILTGRYSFPNKYWKNVSDDAQDLVTGLLTVDPSKRLTVDDALKHKWMLDEDVIRRARDLMYPRCEGMIPPQTRGSPKKRGRPADDDTELDAAFGPSDCKKMSID